jgi:beta-galactosidase
VIHPKGAEVLATYSDGYYAGTPAVTLKRWGKGEAVYQACRDCGGLKEQVLSELIRKCGLTSAVDTDDALPHYVTAHTRTDGAHTYVFVENYSDQQAEPVKLRDEMIDLLSGERVSTCTLSPYGFGIYRSL